jgi:hypothetical protein
MLSSLSCYRTIEIYFNFCIGLKQNNIPSSLPFLITNDGSQTLFSTLPRYIPDAFLVLWRYGLDAFRLKFWLGKKLSNFVR